MYCRECLKRGKTVNMEVRMDKQEYVCPRCECSIEWGKINDE